MLGIALSVPTAAVLRQGDSTPPTPTIPPLDWRMPATVTTSAGLAGSQTALQAAQASAASKGRPAITVASSATEWIEWAVGASATALILSFVGRFIGTCSVTIDGVDAGFTDAYPTGGDVEGNGATTATRGRRQVLLIPAGGARTIRLTCVAGASARTIAPLLHQCPASGPWDAILIVGASREDQGMSSLDMEASIIAAYPTRDPIVLNYARSGATPANIIADDLTTIVARYTGIASDAVIGSLGGNAVTGNTPYSATSPTLRANLDADYRTVINALTGAGMRVLPANISYRAYLSPAVTPVAQDQGSMPFNTAIVEPVIAALTPWAYDTALGIARWDDYGLTLYRRSSLSDEVHGGATQYGFVRAEAVRTVHAWRYTLAWPTPYAETLVAAAEASPTNTPYLEALYQMDHLAAGAAKSALQARLAAVYPYVAYDNASIAVGVAEGSAAQGDKDAAQTAVNTARTAAAGNATLLGQIGTATTPAAGTLQYRINQIVVAAFDQIIRIGHGGTAAVTGWNRSNAFAVGVAIADLLDETGASTGIGYEITNAGTNVGGNTGMVSSVPEVPTAILAAYMVDSSSSMAFKLTGLNPAKLYDVLLMPCRSTATASLTRYTVAGATSTVLADIAPNNNQTETRIATGVAPSAGGEITVTIGRGATGSFAYHTATVVKRHV